MKISVCIVAYNHARYIEDCLASVVGQQVDVDLEILVGDDCSSDDTRKIISSYAERYPKVVHPVFHEKNVGGSQNYRTLIGLSSGDYIAHLDGDDYWLPGKLAAQLAFARQHPDSVAIYSNAIVINDSGQLIARFNSCIPDEFDLSFLVAKGNFLNASSMLYRAEYKQLLLGLSGETVDYLFHILFASRGRLGYVNRDLVAYRRHSATSISSAMPQALLSQYWEAMMQASAFGVDVPALRQCMQLYCHSLIVFSLKQGRLGELAHKFAKMRRECRAFSYGLVLRVLIKMPLRVFRTIWRSANLRLLGDTLVVLYRR
ncbi:MAG: glycosyltransferase [Burkholderiaceae bacterium]|nr:glycosyltransferase [Burkholderiaceae bacterium]